MTSVPNLDALQTPRLAKLQEVFESKHRLCGGLIGSALCSFGRVWAADFEHALASACGDDDELEAAAKGYAAFAFDSMRRQKAFEATGEYPRRSHTRSADEIYFDAGHMMREYLPGLLLSHFLWPHHYRQLLFFDTAFIGAMMLSDRRQFAEVGVGSGIYTRRVLERMRDSTGIGYDISPSACQFVRRHLEAAGMHSRHTMKEQDIVALPVSPVPWMICVEVLEHLEKPVEFLTGLRAGLMRGGKAFITAALNAAHADHMFLYRSPSEVWRHLGAAGFAVEQAFVGTSHPSPSPDEPTPRVAAFVVR